MEQPLTGLENPDTGLIMSELEKRYDSARAAIL
jgi:hypothetical protein